MTYENPTAALLGIDAINGKYRLTDDAGKVLATILYSAAQPDRHIAETAYSGVDVHGVANPAFSFGPELPESVTLDDCKARFAVRFLFRDARGVKRAEQIAAFDKIAAVKRVNPFSLTMTFSALERTGSK